MTENVIRIPPQKYIHVLDNNINLTRLIIGPYIFVKKEHEQVIEGPSNMINMGPRCYCKIQNPIQLDKDKKPVKCGFSEDEELDEVKIRHGEIEIRTSEQYPEPFPLYPGEKLVGKVEKQLTVLQNTALCLQALEEFVDNSDKKRKINEQWHLKGPCTYIPVVEAEVVKIVKSETIKPNCGLRLQALRRTIDCDDNERQIGEEWLVRRNGAYLPGVDEKVIGQEKGVILTDKQCMHLKASRNFTDIYGIKRQCGEEWLVTNNMAQVHIRDVGEEIIRIEKAITLSGREFCVIMNPVQNGIPQWGKKELRTGEQTFFLKPGEIIESSIEKMKVLGDDETILLKASQPFKDDEGVNREAGEMWLIKGPREYIPPCEVEMLELRKAIPLDENEGIYIRNNETGEVFSWKGSTYVLKASESLWEKQLAPELEALLYKAPVQEPKPQQQQTQQKKPISQKYKEQAQEQKKEEIRPMKQIQAVQQIKKKREVAQVRNRGKFQQIQEMQMQQQIDFDVEEKVQKLIEQSEDEFFQCLPTETRIEKVGDRDKTRMITYKAPHNTAVQLYDYKTNKQRVVFGPNLVMLEPQENFTVLTLSGGKPKKEGLVQTIALSLGPDFMTDIVVVETSDHARLSLQLSYNWHFQFDQNNLQDHYKLFSVKDFVGDACKSIASRVRGAVSAKTFEEFHHHSSEIIKEAVFGRKNNLIFDANNLCISSVDIQNIEIIDARTREMLSKSINLAIEISSRSQEATSKHEAELEDQRAKGTLQQQKLDASASAESSKIKLLELEATSKAVQLKGEAQAEAQAKAESAFIAEQAKVKQAELQTQALDIEAQALIDEIKAKNIAEITHLKGQNDLEVKKQSELAEIEVKKFNQIVQAIGKQTIVAISKAGPEMKAKLLNGLGLKGYLVSDGKNPINLFNTANGFLGESK